MNINEDVVDQHLRDAFANAAQPPANSVVAPVMHRIERDLQLRRRVLGAALVLGATSFVVGLAKVAPLLSGASADLMAPSTLASYTLLVPVLAVVAIVAFLTDAAAV